MTHEPPAGASPTRADARARLSALLATFEVGSGPEVAAEVDERPRRRRGAVVKAVAFTSVLLMLVVAIPTLGYLGARTLRYSRAGQVLNPVTDPRAPGYTAIVDSTPTALVIQRDAKMAPVALTVVALGSGDAGGSVLFVPLDTLMPEPFAYIDRLRVAYELSGERLLVDVTARMLNVAFDSVIGLTDSDWARLVGPAAPLSIANPDDLAFFPAGPLALPAEQVGPYLAAQRPGESDLNRLIRHQLVWQAWLGAIGESTSPSVVPGPESPADILGPIARTLAAGTVTVDTLDVVPVDTEDPRGGQWFKPDLTGVRNQVADAVPSPVAPTVGSRYAVRLLNGVDGNPIPQRIVRRLVYGNAQIGQIGNAKRFGLKTTKIEYNDPNLKKRAEEVRYLLGGGTIVFNRKSNEAVDLIVTLGRDVIDEAGAAVGGN